MDASKNVDDMEKAAEYETPKVVENTMTALARCVLGCAKCRHHTWQNAVILCYSLLFYRITPGITLIFGCYSLLFYVIRG